MKVIEGTPEEIKAYLGQVKENVPSSSDTAKVSFAERARQHLASLAEQKNVEKTLRDSWIKTALEDAEERKAELKSDIKGISHWSSTKRMWVTIGDMNENYIINILRQKLTNRDADELLDDGEFQALVVTLSDKILEFQLE